MLDSRNISSHIYELGPNRSVAEMGLKLGSQSQCSGDGVKEIAQQMEHLIPRYYELMVKVLDKTKP